MTTPPPRPAARVRARWVAIGVAASVAAAGGLVVIRVSRRTPPTAPPSPAAPQPAAVPAQAVPAQALPLRSAVPAQAAVPVQAAVPSVARRPVLSPAATRPLLGHPAALPSRAKPEPAKPEPAKPESAKPEPAATESAAKPAAESAAAEPGGITGRQVWAACAAAIVMAGGFGLVAVTVDRPDDNRPAVLATATATPSSSPSPAAPPAPPSPAPLRTTPSPARVGGILPSGVPVIMRGDSGENMLLSIAIDGAPAPTPGNRLVSVTVRVENRGGVAFLDDLETFTWLIDAENRFYGRSLALTDTRAAALLDPGHLTTRTIVFEVPDTAALIRFRLSLRPGAPERTQDWYLS